MRFFSTLIASVLGSLIAIGFLLFFGFLLVFAMASASDQTPSVRSGSVLVFDLGGPYGETAAIDPFAEAFLGASPVDLHDISRALARAAEDDRIEALWLRAGISQTSWPALEVIRRGVEKFKAAGKPVYASSSSHAMSEADYYVASAADSVFMAEEGMFELNGFAMNLTFYAGMLEKLGIKPQTVRAGRFKGAVEPYLRSDLSPENEAQLQALVDDVQTVFIETVAKDRNLSAEALKALSDRGSVVTTREALAAGLIDGYAFGSEVETLIHRRIEGEEDRDLRTVKMTTYARTAGRNSGKTGTIAVVYADGTILPGKTPSSPLLGGSSAAIGSASFVEAMDDAREDDNVDGIVLRINSPGGFAPAADEMRAAVLRASEEKPLYVSMADVAASGGYWIAASADTIVAEQLTLTGSIGVFGLFFDVSDAMEDHLGITFDGVKTGPSADMFSGLRELSTEERRHMEAMTDRTYDEFLRIVAEGRSMTVDQVDAIAQGRVWTGMDALEEGLVDVIGGLDTAIALASKAAGLDPASVRIRELPRPASIMEQFSGSLAARASAGLGFPAFSEANAARIDAMRLMEHPGPYVLLPYRLAWH